MQQQQERFFDEEDTQTEGTSNDLDQQQFNRKLEKEEPKNHRFCGGSETMVVRPGRQIASACNSGGTLGRSGTQKVSVAVDATPATRTGSILNQIPIELTRAVQRLRNIEANEYVEATNYDHAASSRGLVVVGDSEYCEAAEFQEPELSINVRWAL